MTQRCLVPIENMLDLFWDDLDARLTVLKMHEGYDAPFMEMSLSLLGLIEAVRDRDMMRAFGIDTSHLTTEELTVCGGVMVIVVSNEIMDHLM